MPTTAAVAVFTPSHDPTYLDEAYASLKAQTFTEWRWTVVLNRGARWTPPGDPRVAVWQVDELRGVGASKAHACHLAGGDILVELDHDDLLASSALAEIVAEFEADPALAVVYSDCAQVKADGSIDVTTWDQNNGWRYDLTTVRVGRPPSPTDEGGGLCEVDVLGLASMEPTPHNLGLIWFAPNHVRAFARWAYDAAGGYDPDRTELDDQDLLARLFLVGPFRRIPHVLYLQRVHPKNTQADPEVNPRIQRETVTLYDATIERLALAWARRSDLMALDLGGAHNSPPGYLSVDTAEGVDLRGDVFDVLAEIPNGEVGVVRAVDFLEHVADQVALMNELWRVLAPDGLLLSCTPSTDGRGAFQDPTHVSWWNENSFGYYTDAEVARYVPAITARFQVSRLVTYHPTTWHEERQIPYVQANLIALKPGGNRNGGYVRW